MGRWITILVVLAASAFFLYPTFVWSRMSPEERLANPENAEYYRTRAINLGLDLQGGIHMVLGIRDEKLRANILLNASKILKRNLEEKGIAATSVRIADSGDAVELSVSPTAEETRRAEIVDIINNSQFLAEPVFVREADRVIVRAPLDREKFDQEVGEATGRALEIIRNRIDAFGVSEPTIHQSGSRKIVVELPGAADPQRAKSLIGKTAQLEFHKVRKDEECDAALKQMNEALSDELMKLVTSAPAGRGEWDIHTTPKDRDAVEKLLARPAAMQRLPQGAQIFLGATNERQGAEVVPIYLLDADAAMTGENLEMARVAYNERNKPYVSFEFNSEGAKQFKELTSEILRNQGRLAVVLDGVVQSAPVVRAAISRSGMIEGAFSQEEAKELAVVLRSGALPAPVEVLEDRTVGPSLGKDSIDKGILASGIGFIGVLILMVVYYRGSGLIADVCLIMNTVIVMAALALFRGTLTLPGLAGIVLGIGMVVDANILISERIREELRSGKGPFSAIQAGFDNAFWTIFDSNITTLVTAGALYEFGTGPVRGFAVTLSIAILASMFTSIFVNRTIFDRVYLGSRAENLSI